MMKFAREAAKYLPDVEIIEMHHDQKLDAPSVVQAIKTAQMIAEVRQAKTKVIRVKKRHLKVLVALTLKV